MWKAIIFGGDSAALCGLPWVRFIVAALGVLSKSIASASQALSGVRRRRLLNAFEVAAK